MGGGALYCFNVFAGGVYTQKMGVKVGKNAQKGPFWSTIQGYRCQKGAKMGYSECGGAFGCIRHYRPRQGGLLIVGGALFFRCLRRGRFYWWGGGSNSGGLY